MFTQVNSPHQRGIKEPNVKHRLSRDQPAMVEEDQITTRAVLAIVNSIAVLSNLAVLAIIFRSQRTRTVSNLLVAGLALTELLTAVLVIPFSIASFSKTWRYSGSFCACRGYFHNFLSSASATFISVISVEKFYCLSNPMSHAANISGRQIVFTSLFIWFQAAIWAAFPLFQIGSLKYLFIPAKMACGFEWDLGGLYRIYYFVVSMGSFVLPSFTICLMYYKTLQAARRSASQVRPGNVRIQVFENGEFTSVAQQEQFCSVKANIILIIITGTFLVCRIPLGFFSIATAIQGRNFFPEQVEGIISWLLYLGSLINPYVYTLLNRRLRKEIVVLATLFKKAGPEDQEPKDILEYLRNLTDSCASTQTGQQVEGAAPADTSSDMLRTPSQTGAGLLELQILNEGEQST